MRSKLAFIGLLSTVTVAQDLKPELKWSGDLRARGEWSYQETENIVSSNFPNTERYSQVLRARLFFQANQGFWNAGARIVTGCGLPTSSNTTLGNSQTGNDDQSKPIYLDRGFISLKAQDSAKVPAWKTQFWVGKFTNPFYKALGGSSEILFGNDLGPEGAHLNTDFGNEIFRINAQVGRYWVDEIAFNRPGKNDQKDIFQQSEQLSVDFLQNTWSIRASSALHTFNDIKGHKTFGDTTKGYGNITSTKLSKDSVKVQYYTTDFNLWESFVDLSLKTPIPVTLGAAYAVNLADDSAETRDAYLAGIKFGTAKKKGQMELSYAFRKSGANSSLGFNSSPDFGGYKTNSQGSIVSVKYLLLNDLSLDLVWHAYNQINIRNVDEEETLNRVRVELNASF